MAPLRKIIEEMKKVINVLLPSWGYKLTAIRPASIIELNTIQAMLHAETYRNALSFIFIALPSTTCLLI